MMFNVRLSAFALLLSTLFGAMIPSTAHAAVVRILTEGNQEVALFDETGVEAIDVDIAVTDMAGADAEGANVQLINTQTNETFSVIAEGGKASFSGLPAGTYTVKVASDIVIAGAAVSAATIGAALSGAPLVAGGLGVLAVGGGTVAIVNAADDSSSDDNGGTIPSRFR